MSSVDVIVPCYRYAHFLTQCVESVLAQEDTEVRVLIIDDASPDNTHEVARDLSARDPRVEVLVHAANKGHIATYNEGLDWASAAYVLLLSADDFLLPGAFSRATRLMDGHPDVGFVFGNVTMLDDGGAQTPTAILSDGSCPGPVRIMTGREFIQVSGARNIVPTPTAVVRTSLHHEVGGYRPHLPHAGDMELWWRLAARAGVAFVQACQAVYRAHGCSMSKAYLATSKLPDLQQRKEALESFFGDAAAVQHPWAMQFRRPVFTALSREALCAATAAFDAEDAALSRQFRDFARRLSPWIVTSWPWIKMTVKRCIGVRASRTVRRSVEGVGRPWTQQHSETRD